MCHTERRNSHTLRVTESKDLRLLLPLLFVNSPEIHPETNVISTEGGAFAAEWRDPCISLFPLPLRSQNLST